MLPYIEYAYGIYHVTGGLNAISLAMAKVAEEEGAAIIRKSPVKQLILEEAKLKGSKLEYMLNQ